MFGLCVVSLFWVDVGCIMTLVGVCLFDCLYCLLVVDSYTFASRFSMGDFVLLLCDKHV